MSSKVYIRHITKLLIIEPAHDKTNKINCAPSGDSGQPGHPPSLISIFVGPFWLAKDPVLLRAGSEYSDQGGRMPRLIWVFAGRTVHYVGSVALQLNFIALCNFLLLIPFLNLVMQTIFIASAWSNFIENCFVDNTARLLDPIITDDAKIICSVIF